MSEFGGFQDFSPPDPGPSFDPGPSYDPGPSHEYGSHDYGNHDSSSYDSMRQAEYGSRAAQHSASQASHEAYRGMEDARQSSMESLRWSDEAMSQTSQQFQQEMMRRMQERNRLHHDDTDLHGAGSYAASTAYPGLNGARSGVARYGARYRAYGRFKPEPKPIQWPRDGNSHQREYLRVAKRRGWIAKDWTPGTQADLQSLDYQRARRKEEFFSFVTFCRGIFLWVILGGFLLLPLILFLVLPAILSGR